jgi:hypothetical protein
MIALIARAQLPHSALRPRHRHICLALRGASFEAATALRTSWSLSTLQEQTIMDEDAPKQTMMQSKPRSRRTTSDKPYLFNHSKNGILQQ